MGVGGSAACRPYQCWGARARSDDFLRGLGDVHEPSDPRQARAEFRNVHGRRPRESALMPAGCAGSLLHNREIGKRNLLMVGNEETHAPDYRIQGAIKAA